MNELRAIHPVSSLAVEDGIAILRIDSPPVNALGLAVRRALEAGLRAAMADPAAQAIVVACAGRTFFAGADIGEFGTTIEQPDLNQLFSLIERSPKPVVAAIHGTALGGGFELALACHYRVAVPSAKVGLPEVSLGLVPGAGGTQRTPRLAGVARALELMVGGRPIGAGAALSAGLVDALIEDGPLDAGAITYARALIAQGAPLRRVRDMACDLDAAAARPVIDAFVAKNAKNFKGFKAPSLIVEAIEAAVALDFDAGLARETALFETAMATVESGAQRHLFFAERAAAKVSGLVAEPCAIASVAVIGGGTMGSGIATAFLNVGLPVTLIDRDDAAVRRGADAISRTIRAMADKGRIAPAEAERRCDLLATATDIAAIASADLVIEAIYEDLALKRQIFGQIDTHARPGAVLASNTSFLDLNAIAAATGRPDRVVGLHFFAPANIMRLLEVVRGAATADDVIATGMALGRKLGKVAVLSGVCDGFIANRAMAPRVAAAEALILEGPMPWDIDRVMTDYGFPMGVFQMLDLVGLDVIGWDRANSAGRTVQEVLCEAGRWGQKRDGGYYDYDERRRPSPSPAAEAVIREFAARSAQPPRVFPDEALIARLLYPVVNEGAKILEEGIALRATDIDVALVTGYGWPVYTGGPMFWADHVGLPRIVAALDDSIGAARVSPLLRRLAETGAGFTR